MWPPAREELVGVRGRARASRTLLERRARLGTPSVVHSAASFRPAQATPEDVDASDACWVEAHAAAQRLAEQGPRRHLRGREIGEDLGELGIFDREEQLGVVRQLRERGSSEQLRGIDHQPEQELLGGRFPQHGLEGRWSRLPRSATPPTTTVPEAARVSLSPNHHEHARVHRYARTARKPVGMPLVATDALISDTPSTKQRCPRYAQRRPAHELGHARSPIGAVRAGP
jgi:hypothetical protein